MPGGGGDPAAQSIAIQMKQFHPGRSPKPGAFDRHVAGLAQSLALPHRDYCTSLNSARRQLRRRLLPAAGMAPPKLADRETMGADLGPPVPPQNPPAIRTPISRDPMP